MRLPTLRPRGNWPGFVAEVQRDLFVYLCVLAALSVARLVFLYRFADRMAPETGAAEVFTALGAGIRFDAKAAAAMGLAAFACTLWNTWTGGSGQRARSALAAGCMAAIVFLVLLRIEYFVEFNDLYNEILFIAPGEDPASILKTAALGNGMVGKLLLITLAGAAAYAGFRWSLPKLGMIAGRERWRSPAVRAGLCLLVAAVFVVSFRGRLWGAIYKPRDAAVTADAFLNKAVLDDFTSLREAYKKQRKLAAASIAMTPDKVSLAAHELFGAAPTASVDALAARRARGPRIAKPRHIFIIVGESYAAWPMLETYAGLGLADGLRGIAAEDDAAVVRPFLPASSSTMTSVSALVTGLLDVDLETNYRPESKRAYATSLAAQFKSLGYRTRFYYGGFPSWQRLADFVREQGFDDVYAAGHSRVKAGAWGVDDRAFFDAMLRDFAGDAPSFNVVLTTSNHSPFEADLAAAGISTAGFGGPEDPTALRRAHFAYADRAIAGFARAFRARYPESLFVFTGDHAQRLLPKAEPSLYAERAVPFVIWGAGITPGLFPADAAGFHLSIAPTLIELIAPAGHAYHAWVPDMLLPGGTGFQRYVWMTSTAIGRTDAPQLEALPWASAREPRALPGASPTYEALRTLSAWRILQGDRWNARPARVVSAATRSD